MPDWQRVGAPLSPYHVVVPTAVDISSHTSMCRPTAMGAAYLAVVTILKPADELVTFVMRCAELVVVESRPMPTLNAVAPVLPADDQHSDVMVSSDTPTTKSSWFAVLALACR